MVARTNRGENHLNIKLSSMFVTFISETDCSKQLWNFNFLCHLLILHAHLRHSLILIYGKFIIAGNHEYSSHNAVFLLPGHVMESHLIGGTPSVEANTFNNNQAGPLVKRIKVYLISIEYEQFCSFIGTHLPLQDDRAFVGPTSVLGVTFSTKKIDFTTETGEYLMDHTCNMQLWKPW